MKMSIELFLEQTTKLHEVYVKYGHLVALVRLDQAEISRLVQGGLVPSKSNFDYRLNSMVSKSKELSLVCVTRMPNTCLVLVQGGLVPSKSNFDYRMNSMVSKRKELSLVCVTRMPNTCLVLLRVA
jgi:hypothetical protein